MGTPPRRELRQPALSAALRQGRRLVAICTEDELLAVEAVEACAAAEGRPLALWSAADAPSGRPLGEAFLEALDDASEGILMAFDLEEALSERGFSRHLLRRLGGPRAPTVLLVVEAAAPSQSLRPHLDTIPLLPPTLEDTNRRVQSILGPTARDAAAQRKLVRLLHGLSLAALDRVTRTLAEEDPALGPAALEMARQARKRQVRSLPFLEVVDTPAEIDDLGGLDSLKAWLDQRRRASEASPGGVRIPPPRGVLLVGIPGCGKSLAAQVCASFFGIPLLRLEMGALRGGADGPERLLLRGLREAERAAPCVLWIDEIDHALRGASGRAENHGLVGTLASWLQEHRRPVFVAATANETAALPPELARKGRFDEVFFVDLPQPHERAQILDIHLRGAGLTDGSVDGRPVVEASAGFTGAEVAAAVREAVVQAAAEGAHLSTAHLVEAAGRTVPLLRTFEKEIKALRAWARTRARPASADRGVLGLFE